MSRLETLGCALIGLGCAAARADTAWAHLPGGASGTIGWGDEALMMVVPVLLILVVGWGLVDRGDRPATWLRGRRNRGAR